MHTALAALLASAFALSPARAADGPVRIGVLLGLTGPIETIAADMAAAARMAVDEVNAGGTFLGGRRLEAVVADNTCIDAAATTAAAVRLVDADRVAAIVGADCSGATVAVVSNVTAPRGVPTVSPASTSPALTGIAPGVFWRVAPSDARQGVVLAEATLARGIDRVAVTYTNNDYGIGLAESFETAYTALGGEVVHSAAHEDGRADYSAEVATVASSGAEALLVIGYIDQGGIAIVRAALDSGAIDRFIFGDGMLHERLVEEFGEAMDGSFGTVPGSGAPEAETFEAMASAAGIAGSGPYRGESYDATALVALAMHAGGSADRDAVAEHLAAVANAPGERIGPGELARGFAILSAGGEIDYVGATAVELTPDGDAKGSYRELSIEAGALAPVRIW